MKNDNYGWRRDTEQKERKMYLITAIIYETAILRISKWKLQMNVHLFFLQS